MKWAKFFKLTGGKLILSLILFLISNFPVNSGKIDDWSSGLPLTFIEYYPGPTIAGCDPYSTAGLPPNLCGETAFLHSFSITNIILDLIFWYLVSCLIAFVFIKIKKK